jgi:transglycosylase-like protein with SLT domain
MSKPTIKLLNIYLLVAIVIAACGATIAAQTKRGRRADQSLAKPNPASEPVVEAKIIGKEIHFADGSVVRADDVWKFDGDFWYRSGGVTQRVARSVKSVDVVRQPVEKPKGAEAGAVPDALQPVAPDSFWVVLKGGARLKVDEVTKSEEGAWCRRGSFSVLIDTERIDRIERDSDLASSANAKQRDWTTGNAKLDQLIRTNGARFGVDPYLVFCVMEHESQFRAKAISPKGAQGLMQLMPGTAARFGVTNPFDPAQNILGGTRYLKELLNMFGGRIDLALASYNAGEGAVLKYGSNVPPYPETREYVKRISRRYGVEPKQSGKSAAASN